MKWSACATILSLSLICSHAFAREPEPVDLKLGEPVPWDAKCFTVRFAATMAYDATIGADKRVKEAREFTEQLADVRVNRMRMEHAADLELRDGKIQALAEQLERAYAWWKSPLFVASISAVLTFGAILAARYLVIELQPELTP